jgi:hypothetical protein
MSTFSQTRNTDDVKPTTNAISKIYKQIEEMKNEGKGDFFMIDLYTPAISWGPSIAHNKERYPMLFFWSSFLARGFVFVVFGAVQSSPFVPP